MDGKFLASLFGGFQMSVAIDCGNCGGKFKAPDKAAGKYVRCPKCSARLSVPFVVPTIAPIAIARPVTTQRSDETEDDAVPMKFCFECGRRIRLRAEICPKCGVRQPVTDAHQSIRSSSRNGIAVPLLISAILNVIGGLVWASAFLWSLTEWPTEQILTVITAVLSGLMGTLSVYEWLLWSKTDRLSPNDLSRRATSLGIRMCIVGLLTNPITLICGIIVLSNGYQVANQQCTPPIDK